jgi:hypothetical protein
LTALQSFRGCKTDDLVKGSIYEHHFCHTKTQRAHHLFLKWLKNNGQEASPKELSQFTMDLEAGGIVEGFKYRL